MKNLKIALAAPIVILALPLCAMDSKTIFKSAPTEEYPQRFGFVTEETLLKETTNIPGPLNEEVGKWLSFNKTLVNLILTIPQARSLDEWRQVLAKRKEEVKKLIEEKKMENKSKNNFTFEIGQKETAAVIKLASFESRLLNQISSLREDPMQGSDQEKSERIQQATERNFPTQQHITHAATQLVLKRLKNPFVHATPTHLYHIPNTPPDCFDTNYVVVQQRLVDFVPFSSLDEKTKRTHLLAIPLKELYQALVYANIWAVSESNLWVHKQEGKGIAFPDGEKPANEGYGDAKWKCAIFGQDRWKFRHNLRNEWDGGHRGFENILKKYTPELVQAWNELYEKDPDVKHQ